MRFVGPLTTVMSLTRVLKGCLCREIHLSKVCAFGVEVRHSQPPHIHSSQRLPGEMLTLHIMSLTSFGKNGKCSNPLPDLRL
jgi:hypothetical protein